MKTLKTLAILFSLVLLLSSKCNKKNNEPGILKGRLMVNCTTPYANKLVKVQTYIGLSAPHLEDADGNTEFYTDADGYFEIKYFTKAFEGVLYAPNKTMSFIPLGSGQNLDLGEVILNGTVNFVIKTQVNNPHTVNDTLYYSNWSYPNPTDIALKLAGPFQTGIIDTAINVPYTKVQIYNEVPKLNMTYYVNNVTDNTVYFDTPLCSSSFGNVTFVIN